MKRRILAPAGALSVVAMALAMTTQPAHAAVSAETAFIFNSFSFHPLTSGRKTPKDASWK